MMILCENHAPQKKLFKEGIAYEIRQSSGNLEIKTASHFL